MDMSKCREIVRSLLQSARDDNRHHLHDVARIIDFVVVDSSTPSESISGHEKEKLSGTSTDGARMRAFITCQSNEEVAILRWENDATGEAITRGASSQATQTVTATSEADLSDFSAKQKAEMLELIRGYAQNGGRGFVLSPGPTVPPTLHIMSSNMRTEEDIAHLVAHEVTHIVDSSVHKMDLSLPAYLACSEVRAAAGAECINSFPAFLRKRCIRKNATESTARVFPDVGQHAVDVVLEDCMRVSLMENPAMRAPVLLEYQRAVDAQKEKLS